MSLSNTGFSGLDSSSTESIPVTYDTYKIHLQYCYLFSNKLGKFIQFMDLA